MSDTERIEQLRQTIQDEEKRFLMDRYVTQLLGQVENEDELDDRTVESLLVSRPYVSEIMGDTIAEVLKNAGHEVEDVEREDDDDDSSPGQNGNGHHTGDGDAAEDFDTAVEDEDFAALLDGEDVAEGGQPSGDASEGASESTSEDIVDMGGSDSESLEEEAGIADDDAIDFGEDDAIDFGEADDPFAAVDEGAEDDEADTLETDGLGDDEGSAVDLAGVDNTIDAAGLFGDEEDSDLEGIGLDPDYATDAVDGDPFAETDPGGVVEAEASADGGLGDIDGEGLFDAQDTDEVGSPSGDVDTHDPDAAQIEDSAVAEHAAEAEGLGDADAEEFGLFDENEAEPGDVASSPSEGAARSKKNKQGQSPKTVGKKNEDVEEDEEAGMFDQDIYSGNDSADPQAEGDAPAETPGFDPGEGHEQEVTPGFSPTEGHEGEETPGFSPTEGHALEETPGFTATEGHQVEETAGFTPTKGHDVEATPGFTPTEGHEVEETPGFSPTEGHEVEETPGFSPTEGHEVEETAGFTPTKGHDVEVTAGFTPTEGHQVEETAGFTPTKGHDVEETAGFTPTKGHDVEETAGFTPTKGHDVEETAGFTPTKGHDVEETAGFTPTKGHDVEVTPGFTPTEGHQVEETAGFTPTKGHDPKETPGFTATKGEDNRRKKAGPGFTVGEEGEPASTVGKRPGLDLEEDAEKEGAPKAGKADAEADAEEGDEKSRRFQSPQDRAERMKKAQEERRARMRKQQQPQEQEEEEEEEGEELDLDNLTHQISLEDIEQYLGMQVLPDDRQKLERRWQKKTRDPSIRQLLTNSKAMEHPYALVPRLPRFFKGGAAVQANMLNLVRNYPQLFDNVAGLINKYRTEAFFVGETPELDWCIVACEALPESLNRNYMEQKTVVKQYAQTNQTNERRIQRRRLIEILYDCIVINVITKEQILEKTVDLSDSRVGRQNFACVNYGDKGIRINDVSRQQRHPQMGMCPSW